jgi:hypothetical protein
MQPDPEKKACRNKDDLLNGNKEINIHAYLIPGLLSWRREFFRLKGVLE